MLKAPRRVGLCIGLSLPLVTSCRTSGSSTKDQPTKEQAENATQSQQPSPEMTADLRSHGFSDQDIQAAQDSITTSAWLSVKSSVQDANDGVMTPAPDAILRRSSHGKQHGCLRGKFTVTTKTGAGIFAPGASYPAWLRLSNGGSYQRDDKSPHVSRGLGIKLLNVPNMPNNAADIVLLSSPLFFIQDLSHYPPFIKATGEGKFGLVDTLLWNLNLAEKTVIIRRVLQKVANLLDAPLYSSTPYTYQGQPAKYVMYPCAKGTPPNYPPGVSPPSDAGPDYLQDAMNKTLAGAAKDTGLCYNFFLQRPAGDDSVEDPTKEWEGGFDKIAELTIPAGQDQAGAWDYRKNSDLCERLSVNPAHTPDANAPLGKINYTRKYVYANLAEYRRVVFPALYKAWLADHDDPSVPTEIRQLLAELKSPEGFSPKVMDTSEVPLDAGFAALGIR